MRSIIIALIILILSTTAVSAAVVEFDGRHITICDSQGKPCSQLTYSGVNDITTANGYLYLARDNLIKIINIKNPKHPMGVNNFKPGADHIIAQSAYLYTAKDKTLRVYDIADPTKPREIYHTQCKGTIKSIEPHGKYVFIKTTKGLESIKIG